VSQIIKPKRRHTAGVPTTSDLAEGEIAVNTSDYNIYVRDNANNILKIGGVQSPMNEDLDTNNFSFKNTGAATDTAGPSYVEFETFPRIPRYTNTELQDLVEVDPATCTVGSYYRVDQVGDTNWSLMGGQSTPGHIFQCTAAAPTGTTGKAGLGPEFDGMLAYDTTTKDVVAYNFYAWRVLSN
jgi:hypothetical protein